MGRVRSVASGWIDTGTIKVTHVHDFGAIGDGVTDDTTAIQAAIDSADGGGEVRLGPHTYIVKNLSFSGIDNISFVGHGIRASILKLADSADVDVFSGDAFEYLTLRGFTIDGNRANQAVDVHGIDFENAGRLLIRGISVEKCDGSGCRIAATGSQIIISNSIFESNDLRGIHIVGSTFVTIQGNTCPSNGLDGIDIDAFSQNVSVSGNICNGNTRSGIFVEEDCNDVSVVGNVCISNKSHGINVNEQTDGQTTERISVVGNVCRKNDDHGIRVVANVSGTTIRDVTVVGNVSMDNDQDGGGLAGIRVHGVAGATCENVVVVGNRCGDRQDKPTQDYGIDIGTVVDCLIDGNDVNDNVTAGIRDTSSGGTIIGKNSGSDETLTAASPTLQFWGTSSLDSTSNAVGGTLGSGSEIGDTKIIVMTEASNSSTVSVTNHETSDPEIITFAAVDDTAVLLWTGTEWITIKLSGATV